MSNNRIQLPLPSNISYNSPPNTLIVNELSMNFVNRISLIVTPQMPMHQWVISVVGDEAPSLEEMMAESSCYLLDEPAEEVDLQVLINQLISDNFLTIWHNELSVWDEFLDNKPPTLTIEQFQQWFSVNLSGLTFDLASQPLMVANVE